MSFRPTAPVRYARLLAVQVRASFLLAMQYRSDFMIDGVIEVFWAITALVPLFVVFRARTMLAGWTFGQALLVTGWFTFLQGLLEGAINPSLTSVVEHIRRGTLDFILIKPADAQFLVSTSRFQPWRAMNVGTALVIFVVAFSKLGIVPKLNQILLSLVLLATSTVVLYSLWVLTVSAAFHVVRIDNLTYLFSSVFDAARWPISVFRGIVRFIFTVVIPLALMTTYPAEALLGRLSSTTPWFAGAGALVFLVGSRLAWRLSIRKYTSASS